MKLSTFNKTLENKDKKGLIKEKPLLDLLNMKVELKKELIVLKKLHESKKRQLELLEKIEEIDQFITTHKIQK
jgi:SPX domain protein involved in polyphosphate accumulation